MDVSWAIETHYLSKCYGKIQAVSGLNLRVPAGCIYGFLGPNGAGKSTTIRMLLGLIRPTAGEAFVLGRRVGLDCPAARREIGALVEEPAFVDYLSARHNLHMLQRLAGHSNLEEIDEALALVGLEDRQYERVRHYSHGMKQRLGLASALLGRPRLLILDEPAAGLDPQGLVEVRDILRRLRDERGITIFLSSHLLHEVEQLCDEVGVIRRGELIAAGPVPHLLSSQLMEWQIHVDDYVLGRQIVEKLPFVQHVRHTPEGLYVRTAADNIADVNAALVEAGLRVSLLKPQQDLERFYLELMADVAAPQTGRA